MLPLCDVSEHDQEVGRVQVPLRPEPGGGARGEIQSPGDSSVFAECRHCPGSTKLDVAVLQLAQPPQLVLSSAAARVLHSSAAPRVSCSVSAVPPPAAATWTVCWGGDTGHCTSEEVQVDTCTYLSTGCPVCLVLKQGAVNQLFLGVFLIFLACLDHSRWAQFHLGILGPQE